MIAEVASLGPGFNSQRLHHLWGRNGFDGMVRTAGGNTQATTLERLRAVSDICSGTAQIIKAKDNTFALPLAA